MGLRSSLSPIFYHAIGRYLVVVSCTIEASRTGPMRLTVPVLHLSFQLYTSFFYYCCSLKQAFLHALIAILMPAFRFLIVVFSISYSFLF